MEEAAARASDVGPAAPELQEPGRPLVPFYTWDVPGKSISVDLQLGVILGLQHAIAASAAETAGLLLGRSREGQPSVIIEGYKPLPCDHSGGPRLVLSEVDERRWAEAITRHEHDPSGLGVVGWYRSNTRGSLAMDDEDLRVMRKFFPGPSQLFLLIAPAPGGVGKAGFFFWEQGNINRDESYRPFPFDAMYLICSDPQVQVVGGSELVRPAGAIERNSWLSEEEAGAPAETAAAGLERRIEPTDQSPRRARFWKSKRALWLAPVLVGAGIVAVTQYPRPPAAEAPLGLRVERQGADLRLTWNRHASAVRKAQQALISITDGQTRQQFNLDASQVRTGSLVYTPLSGDVSFQVAVFDAQLRPASESVRVLAPGAAPPAQSAPQEEVSNVPAATPPDVAAAPAPAATAPASQRSSPKPSGGAAAPRGPSKRVTAQFTAPRSSEALQPATLPEAPSMEPRAELRQPAGVLSVPVLPPPVNSPAGAAPQRSTPASAVAPKRSAPVRESLALAYVPPRPVRQVAPVIPATGKNTLAQLMTGPVDVEVKVFVDATGKVSRVEPVSKGGRLIEYLSGVAAGTARLWRFQPAELNGQKVPGETVLRFRFDVPR